MIAPEYNASDPALYDDHAAVWWDGSRRWIRTLQNMVPGRLKHFDPIVDDHGGWHGKQVLDVGCAGGFLTEVLAARGADVTGIDPARKAIEAARAHAAEIDLDIRYDIGVGETLPYEDGSFDIVTCVDVLEHVTDLEQTIAEIKRVLKPGGLFLYDTINRNLLARIAVITLAEDVLRLLPRGAHDHRQFIKPAELLNVLKLAGLEPGRITGLGPRGVNRRFDPVFGPLPITSVIYMGHAVRTQA